MRSGRLTAAVATVFLTTVTLPTLGRPPVEGGENPPCGELALTVLGRLLGTKPDPEPLRRALGPGSATGHSLAELIAGGRSCGLRLRGVHLDRENWPLDGPAVLHLRREGKGHFVVIRAVGQTGRFVQILDPPRPSQIVDFGDIARGPGWTGAALIPEAPGWGCPGPASLAGLCILSLGLASRALARRSRPEPGVKE